MTGIENNTNLSCIKCLDYVDKQDLQSPHYYHINSNSVFKTLTQDTAEFSGKKNNNTKRNILIGAGLAIAAVATFIFTRGKCGKNLSKTAQEAAEHIKPKTVGEDAAKVAKEAEAKAAKEAEAKVAKEAEAKAAKELENISNEIPNMSRADIAKERYELAHSGGEITKLKDKAKKEGLTELENIRLDFLKRKLELFNERELQIQKSLEKYVPTVSENSAVSMHHEIHGKNIRIRNAVECRTKTDLNEKTIASNQEIEKYIDQIDKEFAQLPPLEKDCIVYRGRAENPIIERLNTDFKIMENAKVGDTVVPDTAYSYNAFDYNMANNWCQRNRMTDMQEKSLRTIMYEIHLPKGAKVSRNLEHKGEVVMPRGAEYIVKDKNVDSEGCINVVLEYILPKGK